MAVAQSQEVRWIKCENCGDVGKSHEYVGKRFCSWRCKCEHIGEETLRTLKYDHTTCASCWAQLKSVYRPEGRVRGLAHDTEIYKRPPDIFIGLQDQTPEADPSEDAFEPNGHQPKPFWRKTSCGECGNVNPKYHIEGLVQFAEGDPPDRLFDALCRLESRGKIDTQPNYDTLHDALNGDESLAYAIGKSLTT